MRTPFILFALACLAGCILATNTTSQLSAPYKVIYIDWHVNWSDPSQSVLGALNAGYNVIILAFYLSSNSPADMATAWAGLSESVKLSTIQAVHNKGGVVLVSVGGATDSPFGVDPNALGTTAAKWALSQHLDGVDFDIENLAPGFRGGALSGDGTVDWLVKVTQAARNVLGANGVVTHAPQGPYFGNVGGNLWTGSTGGYTSVYAKAGGQISFLNVQFYNQGASCYVDYEGLFEKSCSVFPGTSVNEIKGYGVPLNKIVVGKPITSADASNGWMSGGSLHSTFEEAKSKLGWDAGVMGWVWNDPNTCESWIHSVYP